MLGMNGYKVVSSKSIVPVIKGVKDGRGQCCQMVERSEIFAIKWFASLPKPCNVWMK